MARRIALGFAGGPTLAARVEEDELDRLRAALGGTGARAGASDHELRAEDGVVLLRLEHVAYLRVEEDEPRIGFG